MAARGRICLHSPFLYPLFADGRISFAGGAETQQAAIARGLVSRDFDVRVVTCDFGQPAHTVLDGVQFFRSYAPERGWPVLRFLHPRLTGMVSALRAARADVYYARGGGLVPGLTSDVARQMHAGFVLACAHDLDTESRLPRIGSPRDRWWYRRAIRHADRIVAQTRRQRDRFRENFDREADVVPNLVAVPESPPPAAARNRIVWLSTYKATKRPEWFTALARRLPDYEFDMRGVVPPPPLPRTVWDAASEAAAPLDNLTVGGYLEPSELFAFLSRAALFIHTSPAEGFPNTLLEAWAHGVPSLVCNDPDGVVEREGLGQLVHTTDELVAATEEWMRSPDRLREAGERSRRYVRQHHGIESILNGLTGVFEDVIETHRGIG